MANIPDELKYTKGHEWVRVENDIAVEGISDYAQSELSDIVMVEPPAIGRRIKNGESVGTIEAVKAVSDLYAGVSGEVIEVNNKVVADPSVINRDPYGEGWIFKVRIVDRSEVASLMSAEQYKELIAKH